MDWLNGNITIPDGFEFYKASSHNSLLNTSRASSRYKYSSIVDVKSLYTKTGFVKSGIVVVIKIQKKVIKVQPSHNMQVIMDC